MDTNETSLSEDAGDYFYQNIDVLKEPWVHEPHFVPLVLVYGLVFLLGIIGNAVVVFSVLWNPSLRNATFYFIVSLAVADILFLLVVIPHESLRMVLGEWPGGRVYCKVSGFTEMMTAVASILNLTALSFERYFVIALPIQSRRRCTISNTRRALIAVWVVALLIASPSLYVKDTESSTYFNNVTSVTLMFCSDHGVSDHHRIYFAVYQLLVMFIIPTILMTFCYSVVIYVLWLSRRTLVKLTSSPRSRHQLLVMFIIPTLLMTFCYSVVIYVLWLSRRTLVKLTSSPRSRRASNDANNGTSETCVSLKGYHPRKFTSTGNDVTRNSIIEGRKQVIKMLIIVVLTFLLCWGPKLVFQLFKYSEYRANMHFTSFFKLQIAIYCLPYIQSCLNPVIYCLMSQSFRKGVIVSCQHPLSGFRKLRKSNGAIEIEMDSKLNNGYLHARSVRSTNETYMGDCF